MHQRIPGATTASLQRSGLSLEDATNAGIAALACSTLLLSIVLMAMLLLPVGIG
jgi:hypothetical protein